MKHIVNYQRVIPRDLFNESKLLKCMGRLVLLIHDRLIPFVGEVYHDGSPFNIVLLDEGALMITNVKIKINGKFYYFQTTYNSKSNYPFFLMDGYDRYEVFCESGEFHQEFIEFCKQVK